MDRPGTPGPGLGEVLLGLGVAGLGLLILVQTTQLKVAASYARISPKLFPGVIGAGLLVLGLVLAFQAWRARSAPVVSGDPVHAGEPTDLVALGSILGGLLVYALLLVPLGFVLASTLLFTSVVVGFGSRSFLRDAGIGLALSLVAWFLFKQGLGLQLPPGILAGLL